MGVSRMNKLNVKIKLLNGGKLPELKTKGAAAYDVYANEAVIIKPGETKIIKLGFAIEVPIAYYAEIRGRSGLSSKGLLGMTGTIDSDYRGEVCAIISNLSKEPALFDQGDRVAQMQIKPVIDTNLILVDDLSDTERGAGGFGSTGIK